MSATGEVVVVEAKETASKGEAATTSRVEIPRRSREFPRSNRRARDANGWAVSTASTMGKSSGAELAWRSDSIIRRLDPTPTPRPNRRAVEEGIEEPVAAGVAAVKAVGAVARTVLPSSPIPALQRKRRRPVKLRSVSSVTNRWATKRHTQMGGSVRSPSRLRSRVGSPLVPKMVRG